MNWLDRSVIAWLNHFARASYTVDAAVAAVVTSNLLKGCAATLALTWFWFARGDSRRRTREIVVATFVAAAIAIIGGRLLATLLPFRLRPSHDPTLHFVIPYGYPDILRGWSAFPSDHAMLFAAIATGLWFISRRAGTLAYAYTFIVILLPRLYFGMHYPTDVLFGIALGAAIAVLANGRRVRERVAGPALRWSVAHPSSFYAFAFIVVLQVSTMFTAPREFLKDLAMKRSASMSASSRPATSDEAAVVRVVP